MQDVESGYTKKVKSAKPNSQPSKFPPIWGDTNISSQIENKTNATVYELPELGIQLIR